MLLPINNRMNYFTIISIVSNTIIKAQHAVSSVSKTTESNSIFNLQRKGNFNREWDFCRQKTFWIHTKLVVVHPVTARIHQSVVLKLLPSNPIALRKGT